MSGAAVERRGRGVVAAREQLQVQGTGVACRATRRFPLRAPNVSRFGLVCAALLVVALLAPAMGAQAQQRRSPDAPNLLRSQAAPARLGPVPVDRDFVVDEGDAYLTPSGEVRLLRVTNEAAVRYADDVAAPEGFNALQQSLTGRSVERTASIAPSGIDIVRDSSVRKDGQAAAATPNALAEALTGTAGGARTYPVYVAPDGTTRMVAADEILVCLEDDASAESLAPRFAAAGAVVDRRTRARDLDVYVVRLQADAKSDALAASKEMSAWPEVAWAQPNFTRELSMSAAPDDPLFGFQQGLDNSGQNRAKRDADMSWMAARELVQGDPNIVIAIIDDGVDTTHPDLLIAPGGYDFYNDDDDPNPVGTDGHGTGCAGVAAAAVNNARNMAGVAGGCGILPIKIAESSFATDEVIGDAIRYAADHADILSNSWGGGTSDTYIDTAIDYATTSGRDGKGCAVFFATGNLASRWYQGGGRNTVSFAGIVGDYYFGFTYEKDGSVSQGLDAAWVDNVCILEGDGYTHSFSQDFEGAFPPSGWTVQTNAGPGAYWTLTGADAFTGTGGTRSPKSGAISHGQYTTLRSPLRTFSGDETVAVTVACSSEFGYDVLWLDLFDSGGSLVGRAALATGVPSVTTDLLYPASYANAIAVGSATDCDRRADYSQYGTGLDFLAPSNGGWNDVATLDPVGTVGWTDTDYKMSFGGTSSACPAAAGIAALALSADPDLTAGEVREVMRKSCDKIGGVVYSGGDAGAGGWHEMYGYGRLNALAVAATLACERIYFNPFDTDPGWSTEGQWEFGEPQGVHGDPDSGFSGANVYGYNLAGDYENNIPEHFLMTPALDCSLHQGVRLQFRRWLGVESATRDQARIQVSNDGAAWVDVWSNSAGSEVDTDWRLENYDISAVADGQSTVYVRWGMGPTDGSQTFCGWNIDDFELLGLPAGRLNVAPATGFDSAGYQGGPFTPASFDYTLTNNGTEPLTWSASHATSWLDVSPTSGALEPGADAVVRVSLNADANSLAPGTHTDTLTFATEDAAEVQERAVTLDVTLIPGEIQVTDSVDPVDDHAVPFGLVQLHHPREEEVYVDNLSASYPLIVSDIGFAGYYFEDFEDGLAQDWTPLDAAHWSVVGGEYQAAAGDYSTVMQSSYRVRTWQDASVSVRMRRTGGTSPVAAVFLRCSPGFDYANDVGSAYGVGINGDGSFWVIKWVDGAMAWLQGWAASPFLNTGETSNDVTLSIEGTEIRVYFNGNLAWSGSDGSVPGPGSIALGSYSGDSSPETVHYFDDVLVQRPMTDGATMSAEQAWHNLRGAAGDLNVAPTMDAAAAKYDGPTSEVAPLDIRAQSLDAPPFFVPDAPALPYSIGPGGRLTLTVRYDPAWAGVHEQTLRITTNDATTPEVDVALTGTCYDPIQIAHTPLGTQYDEVAEYVIGATITSEKGLARAEVFWNADGGAYAAQPMAMSGADWFEAAIPAQPIGTTVGYYIECEDVEGDIVRLPWDAPTTGFTFDVVGTSHLSASPTSLSYVLAPDTLGTQAVELTNTGTASLDWQVFSTSYVGVAGSASAFATDVSDDLRDRGRTPDWTKDHNADTLLVGFRKGRNVTAAATQALHASVGATVAHRYRRIPVEVVRVPEGATPQSLASAYMASDLVAYVEPNYRVQATKVPNDPLFGDLWGLENTGQTGGAAGADISAPAAWDTATGSADVIIGVIDTGIDYTHPDLVGNMWINPSPTFGDVHGARWTNGDGTVTSGDPMDDHSHGTHCAGTIAATGDDGEGVAGVNWQASLMGLKFLDSSGFGDTADAIAALEYAIDHGAHLTSNSWGGDGYGAAMEAMIAQAQAANQLFIAAAGNYTNDNDAVPYYPASYTNPNVIAVAASDHNDNIAAFSHWGATSVDLAAPGVNIVSTVPGGYDAFNGTSMATPHVSGVAALALSIAPNTPWDVLKGWILDSVDVLPAWSGLTVTGGRLNAHETILAAGVSWLSMAPDAGTLAPGESITVQVTADATGLPDGTFEQAQLLFTGDVDGPTPVDVSLLVAGGDFVVSPADPMTFSGPEGGPYTPESGVYTLRNLGGAALQWTASGLPEWLEADDPLSGELPAGGTATFTVRPNALASGMPFGSYPGALTFEEVGGASATFSRPVALDVAMPAPDPFYTDPFDTDPGWTVEGQWAFGAPQGNDGDPAAAFTGSNVYGYNLSGAYADDIPEYFLTTTALDCSDYANVHLQFQRWLGVESSTWDHARIQASNDGATWVDVWNHVGGTVADTAWQQVTYDMSAVADGQSTVYVRWGMGPTDGSVAYFGWNIDDLTLLGVLSDDLAVVPSTEFESAGLVGGPFTSASIDYTLTNRGAAAVTWSLAHAAPWLDVSSTGGALDPGAHAVVTVSLNADADQLSAGSYADTLVFTNEDSGVTQERQVSVNVSTAPVVNFASGASSAGEADGTVFVDVALSLASSLPISVDYAVTGGTATGGGVDYTLASGTLDFAPGGTGKPIVVTLNDDLADEDDETVVVTLSNPVDATLGAPDTHTLTITDDDEMPRVAFARSASAAGEADGIVPVDVTLSAPSGLPVSVHYAVTGGTATGGGVDYTLDPGTLDFAPGEQTKTIEAPLTDDGELEDAETIRISLDSPVNATIGAKNRHTITITDLAPIALSTDDAAEGMEDTAVRADADVTSATRAAEVYSAMRRDNDHWVLHSALGLAPGDDINALSIPESDCAEPGLFASDTALYGQSYGNQDNGVTPSATTGDGGAMYERFDGVGEPITSVRWWGVTRRVSDGAPEMRDPDAYRVSFHADDAGEPGAEAAVYTVTPTRSATPLMAAGCTVYVFDAELPAPVELATGWLSIYGVDDADTEFAWAHAQDSDGDGVSHRLVGATYDIGAADMAFALGGALTAGAPPLGVHWHFSVDPAAVGVEGIAPDLHSEARNEEAAGDVFVSDGSARNALAVEDAYLGLQAAAGGEPDNMDALDMRVIPLPTSGEHLDRDAVYFSLTTGSPSLASASGGPFAPGDLLASDGNGGFYAVATDDTLGIAGEDMDALFVSASGEVFFSVSPGGPGGYGPGDLLGADGVFGYAADGAAEVIVDAAGLGLAEGDDLNGLDALAQPDERFNRLVVPFFLDSAPANEAAQTAGVRTWIAVKNLSPEDAPMMVQYVRANGSDITPDVYKHTLDPWQGLGWRPSVRDTGPEGEGIGAAVPDTGDGSIAGSAIVSFLEGNPMAGRLIMTSPDSQAAFTLPAMGRTTKLVVPFYLDDAAGDGQLPSVGSQTYIGVKNLNPDPVRLRITYTKPTGVDITPEDNTYILPGYAGVSWRPTVDDGFNEGVGVDVPNATGMITGSATIEATGPIAGRLVQWSAGADGFMQCAYALPDAAGSGALVSPLFLDDAPNGGLPPAAGFMSYIGVKNLLTAPQDVDVAYRSRGGADRTQASASYTWTGLLGISWRPSADDGFNEGVGANVPNITEGTEGSAVISGLGARLAGRFLASAPTDLFAHTLPSAGGSKSLVVPFFQDNASVDGELFPETGMLSLIVVRNLSDADVPITITYQDRLGDATPAANTYTIPANATVAWRPRATDAGVEGADGATVPDSTSPITSGSAEITAPSDALAGILITTSGDGASAYVLPAR